MTEREHVTAADPVATERFLAHLRRSAKTGILVLGKAGAAGAVEAKLGEKKPAAEADDAPLSPAHQQILDSFNRGKPPEKQTTVADYRRSLASQARTTAPNAGGGVA